VLQQLCIWVGTQARSGEWLVETPDGKELEVVTKDDGGTLEVHGLKKGGTLTLKITMEIVYP
jgi:hypothetical protein